MLMMFIYRKGFTYASHCQTNCWRPTSFEELRLRKALRLYVWCPLSPSQLKYPRVDPRTSLHCKKYFLTSWWNFIEAGCKQSFFSSNLVFCCFCFSCCLCFVSPEGFLQCPAGKFGFGPWIMATKPAASGGNDTCRAWAKGSLISLRKISVWWNTTQL